MGLHILKLVRWPNLLIVFITQWIVWVHVIKKSLQLASLDSNLTFLNFCLLSFSTILVAAAGYVINDIEDVNIDLINKPDKVIVSRLLTMRTSRFLYASLHVLGLGIAIYLGIQLEKVPFIVLFPIFGALLHFYATHLKKTPLIGNIIISLFVACVPLIIFLADIELLLTHADPRMLRVLALYCLLAFLANLARELVKDMQDIKGDMAFGARTFPILFGFKQSKILLYLILFSTLFVILVWTFVWDVSEQTATSIGLGMVPLLLICSGLILSISRLESPKDYGKWSLGIKLFMLFGLVFFYLQSI